MTARTSVDRYSTDPVTPLSAGGQDLQDGRNPCGWCSAPVPPGEECFCSDVCYAACKTDQFGEASGKRLAAELNVDFSLVLDAWRSGPWFCKVCGRRPVPGRLQLCSTCTPGPQASC